MSEEIYTVEQFAERLKLHPKTVLRFIREGRVRAMKVGRSYRILRSDLEAMTGVFPTGPSRAGLRVTSIIDLADVDPRLAARLTTYVTSVRMGTGAQPEPMNVTVANDPARRSLKIVLVGSPADTADMLRLVQALAEN